ncbi:MAG: MBL fold metallo-hydrolase [Patescibacteria group bacterium]
MNIYWLGHSCFKIEEKINGILVTIVTDPFGADSGLKLTKTKADIVTVSHGHDDHANVGAIGGIEKETPIVFDRPGEYEVKNAFITGIGAYHDKKEGAERGKSTMFLIDVDGVTVLHLGDLGTALSDQQLEKIGEVDVLLIPVGGKYTINAAEAAEVVRQIEPRIVIPMHYKTPELKIEIDGLDKFKKEMGGKFETLDKLKVSKKDLPQDEVKVVILEKS